MAHTYEEERVTVIPKRHELLLEVHQELLKGGTPAHTAHQERRMDLEGSPRPSLPGVEEKDG